MKKTYLKPVLNDEEFELEECIMIEGSTEQQEIGTGEGDLDIRMFTEPGDVAKTLGFEF